MRRFRFRQSQLLVQRSFVNGRVDEVKTEYSQDYVPLHPSLTEIVLKWSTHAVTTEEGCLCQPENGLALLSHRDSEAASSHLGLLCGGMSDVRGSTCVWCNHDQKTGNGVCMLLHETRVKNSGKYGGIGWHTLRHT
jgi:hypothetical protein